MAATSLDKAPPPYMSASLLKSTVEQFANSIVPMALDRHVLEHMSGADYGSLMSGMRFLGLVEPNGTKPTDAFRALVKAKEKSDDDYQSALLSIVNTAYERIVGNVDLDGGTLNQLEKAFRDYGVSPGQMLTKTVRFYIKVLQEAGITLSPYITKQRRSTNGGRSKKTTPSKGSRTKKTPATPERREPETEQDVVPSGFGRQPIPGVDGAFIQYPTDLSEANCDLFDAVMVMLRAYAKARSGKESV